jgi:FMN-dependent NADH-azoreductase
MKSILQLNTSLFGDGAQSSRLAGQFVAALAAAESSQVVVRDLGRHPVAHLTAERFQAFTTAPEERTPQQQRLAAESDALIDELRAADTVVLGLPMYNFGVPSTLKAWFDHVARAGITFRYTESGPVGLMTGKKAYVIATRGGRYAGTPRDMQSAFVRQFLGFIGITDVEFVYAEGLALGAESRDTALRAAGERLEQLAA